MNLSPIGTAYQASRNQSFNGIGGAAQSGMDGFMQMFGQVAEKRKAGVDNEVKKSLANLMAALQHRKALEPPKPTPIMQKRDMAPLGLGLLLALLTKQKGSDIADFGQGFLGARQMGANQQDQYNQQAWQTQNQNAQAEQQMEIERAKLGYGAATDEQSRFDRLMQDDRKRADERYKQDQLTKRAEIRSPDKVEYYKMLGRTPQGRQELTMAVVGNDPDAIEAARQLTEQEKLLASRRATEDALRPGKVEGQTLTNQGKRLGNEFLSKTLNDRVDIIASQKGIKETQLEVVKRDLQHYDEDRALKVAQARARIAASNRSGRAPDGSEVPLTVAQQQKRDSVIRSSTKELMDLAKDQLKTQVPALSGNRAMSEAEILKRAEIMARNGDPVVKPLLDNYNDARTAYERTLAETVAKPSTKATGGGGTTKTVDSERAMALKAYAAAKTEQQRAAIRAMYRKNAKKELF